MVKLAKYTKQAICTSFMKLLNEKSLEQITVKDIVDECDLNRKTFYYYYRDIYDLMDDVFKMRIEEIKKETPPENNSPRDAMKVIADYLYKNKVIAAHVCRSLGYEKLNDILFDASMRYLPELVRKSATGLTICESDMTSIASYYAITLAGILTKWISHGMKTIPQEGIDRFFDIMEGCARLSLENADRLNKQKQC